MPATDHIFDQRGLNLKRPPAAAAKTAPQTHFRVHLADGSKHDVLAASSADANKHVEKLFPGIKVTKTKRAAPRTPA
ncbi:hypothetical protein [Neorhizobium galegae]|uniref:hypothetical protein n=1 Tax=Neorhizobium galegae TaxID=399 RepID=UPI001F1728B2|nr:hypothetical protein [Neorhizobium galegae]UIK04879.1 hypothetical protein LZK81_19830 [Neorhizobium galegae]